MSGFLLGAASVLVGFFLYTIRDANLADLEFLRRKIVRPTEEHGCTYEPLQATVLDEHSVTIYHIPPPVERFIVDPVTIAIQGKEYFKSTNGKIAIEPDNQTLHLAGETYRLIKPLDKNTLECLKGTKP